MNRRLMLMPLVLVALGACQGTELGENATADSVAAAPAPSAMDADVERAVAVYRGIEAAPAAAESVLTANGLTEAGFDSLMYEIAADSARAAAYTDAIR